MVRIMKIRFGDCRLDTESRQLWRSESTIPVSPKAFDLLQLLVARRPGAISKSELHERIWPGTFVSDDSLSRLIVEVREATGDDARRPRFVRTLHGFGYAFSATLKRSPIVTNQIPLQRSRSTREENRRRSKDYRHAKCVEVDLGAGGR